MKVVNLNNRAARRWRLHNRRVQSDGAVPLIAVTLTATKAIKRDGTVGPFRIAAAYEGLDEDKRASCVMLLVEKAVNYGGSKDSEENGIARLISPEATLAYRKLIEDGARDEWAWAKYFQMLAEEGVTFSEEERLLWPERDHTS